MSTIPTFSDYEAKYAAIAALEAQILPENKAALLDALAAADIARVVVGFDGGGTKVRSTRSPRSAYRRGMSSCRPRASTCIRAAASLLDELYDAHASHDTQVRRL